MKTETDWYGYREGEEWVVLESEGVRLGKGHGVYLVVLLGGEVWWQIPELGGRRLGAGEWCLLGDHGPLSAGTGVGELRGMAFPWPVEDQVAEEGAVLPARLACLSCPHRSSAFFLSGSCSGRMSEMVETLLETRSPSLSWKWMRRSLWAELVARVHDQPDLQGEPGAKVCCCGRDAAVMERVAQDLKENLGQPHSIASLARRHFINECSLKQEFKRHYGTTLFAYLRQKRMERALALLRRDHCSVLEAATAVGYSNPSHFARAFRAVHAINPRDARRLPPALPAGSPQRDG